MACGENMKVRCCIQGRVERERLTEMNCIAVDYILFLTADVTVTPNANEIRDYKYVSKAELQAMFEDPSSCLNIFWTRGPS